MADVDGAANLRPLARRLDVWRIADRGRLVEDVQHPLPGRHPALQQIGDPAERDHRPTQHRQIRVEGDELADRDAMQDHIASAEPEHDQRRKAEEERHAREEQPLEADQLAVAGQIREVRGTKARNLRRFLPIGPHHAHARQRLLGNRAQVRQLLLNLLEAAMDGVAEVLDRDRDERQRQQRDQRQLHVDRQHQRDGDDEEDAGAGGIHHRRADHHADGVEIVGCARHQVAGAMRLVVAERQPLQMREEVVAEVVFELTRGANQQAPGQIAEHAADDGGGERGRAIEQQLARGDAGGEVVDRVLQNPGAGELDRGGDQRAEQPEGDLPSAAADVRQQAAERGHLPSMSRLERHPRSG